MPRHDIWIPEDLNEDYNTAKEDIRRLWFKRYGESISISKIIVKALIYFRDYLKEDQNDISYDSKRKDLHKYERIRS